MDNEKFILHPRAVGSTYQGGYTVLHLERGMRFQFSTDLATWFEGVKQPKSKGQILRSLPHDESHRVFGWLLDQQILLKTDRDAIGEMPAALASWSANLERGAQPLMVGANDQWQTGFVFADATISLSVICA